MLNSFLVVMFNKFVDLLSNNREFQAEREKSQLQILVFIVLLTSLFMWAYAIISIAYTSHTFTIYIGITASIIHLLSLLLYYLFGSITLSLHTTVLAGFVHQVSFAMASGGFDSSVIIWIAILPLIAGVIGSRIDLLIWFFITLSTSVLIYILKINGYPFHYLMTSEGLDISHALISVGFIILNTSFILAYILDRDRKQRVLLEKKNQIENLLTIVGHDVSNPLTVISLSTKRLIESLKNSDDKNVLKNLARLENSSSDINQILNQIRELQAIKSGKLELSISSISLNKLITHSLGLFEEQLIAKRITVNFNKRASQNTYIYGNQSALRFHVFDNIISNAIKFSEPNSTIDIIVEKHDREVIIKIIDYGVGMDDDLLAVIFDDHIRTTSEGTSGEVGTGFGMPIIRTYVELNHGKIAIESKTIQEFPENHGTRVSLSFMCSQLF